MFFVIKFDNEIYKSKKKNCESLEYKSIDKLVSGFKINIQSNYMRDDDR